MWLTGFDVPFLDSIYIDKPIQQHNLIQTISRVNRKYEGKNKGLVVDYIGIKTLYIEVLHDNNNNIEVLSGDIRGRGEDKDYSLVYEIKISRSTI